MDGLPTGLYSLMTGLGDSTRKGSPIPAIVAAYMIHRGTTREPKMLRQRAASSTPADKLRRHRNKKRNWQRAVARLAATATA